MSTVRLLAENESERWDAFVASREEGSIYHTTAWRDLVRNAYGHIPLYLVIEDGQGGIRAGLPAFLVRSGITGVRISSLPCAHFCNPLVDGQNDLDLFIGALRNLMDESGAKYLELKTSREFGLKNAGMTRAESYFSDYVLDIDRPLETIIGSFHKSSTQRILRHLDKSGLRLRRTESPCDISAFYHLYLGMRKKHGLLPQPLDFFTKMWEILRRHGNIEILHAEFEGKIVSSAFFLRYRDTWYYEYGVSNAEMLHLHPSHFLLWTAIKKARELGLKRFDFGRTTDDNTGLVTFKLRWGSTRIPLDYYYFPGAYGVAGMRRDSIQKKVMNRVIRLSPTPLCRLMGKLLYRSLV